MRATLDHDQAFTLLPWLVNGTLTGDELRAVESHVRDCVPCRLALREQQRLHAAIVAQPIVQLSPQQGLDRLLRELDGEAPPSAGARRSRRARPLRRASLAIAATVAVASVVVSIVMFPGDGARDDGRFTTLTNGAPANDARLDVIFADGLDEGAMRALLREIGATIVAGPSERGRYTISLEGNARDQDVAAALERLRQDRRVRFVARSLIEEGA